MPRQLYDEKNHRAYPNARWFNQHVFWKIHKALNLKPNNAQSFNMSWKRPMSGQYYVTNSNCNATYREKGITCSSCLDFTSKSIP